MSGKLKTIFVKIPAVLVCLAVLVLIILQAGTEIVKNTWSAWSPDYDRIDIMPILEKSELTEEDYDLLYRQTGLTKLGIDGLRDAGKLERIMRIQDDFFSGSDYYYNVFDPFTGIFEKKAGSYEYAMLENGDILYAPGSYFSFVRLGHCSIVVNENYGILAENQGYSSDFIYSYAETFCEAPAFAILRVKADKETRNAVARFVKDELKNTEYAVFGGVIGGKNPETLERTQCSHMLWYAYYQFGIDIDANGGIPMMPYDIFASPNVEVVQVFGMDPIDVQNNRINTD